MHPGVCVSVLGLSLHLCVFCSFAATVLPGFYKGNLDGSEEKSPQASHLKSLANRELRALMQRDVKSDKYDQ